MARTLIYWCSSLFFHGRVILLADHISTVRNNYYFWALVNLFFLRNKNNHPGPIPTNGFSPNFHLPLKSLADGNKKNGVEGCSMPEFC